MRALRDLICPPRVSPQTGITEHSTPSIVVKFCHEVASEMWHCLYVSIQITFVLESLVLISRAATMKRIPFSCKFHLRN